MFELSCGQNLSFGFSVFNPKILNAVAQPYVSSRSWSIRRCPSQLGGDTFDLLNQAHLLFVTTLLCQFLSVTAWNVPIFFLRLIQQNLEGFFYFCGMLLGIWLKRLGSLQKSVSKLRHHPFHTLFVVEQFLIGVKGGANHGEATGSPKVRRNTRWISGLLLL